MKKNPRLIERLNSIYDELGKAERQISRQTKDACAPVKRNLSWDVEKAKKAIERLYWCYETAIRFQTDYEEGKIEL